MRRLIVLLVALALLPVPLAAGLSLTEVAVELRCVTCGTPLDVSDAPAAQQMKDRIQRRISEGRSKQEIIDEFVAIYGEQVLATPPKRGFGLIAWLLPALGVAIGLAAIPFMTRAWTRRRAAAAVPAAPLSDEDRERVQRELDALGDL